MGASQVHLRYISNENIYKCDTNKLLKSCRRHYWHFTPPLQAPF